METVNLTTNDNQSSNEQKLADARELIAEFFHATDLEFIRVELWQFLKAVTTEKPFYFLGDPSTVLCLERHLQKIIKVCRLLLDVAEDDGIDLDTGNFQPFSHAQIEADRKYIGNVRELNDRYGGMIHRLSLAETEQPLLAIKRVFEIYSYDQWQEILEDWVEYALSKVSICEATGECAEIIQYELLESLLEAIYLISRSDQGIPYQKRRLGKVAGGKAIIELLIAALDPLLIFEVKHPTPELIEQKPYRELLIVFADDNQKPFKEYQPIVELSSVGDEKLCCSVHKLSNIHHALISGQVYFLLACTNNNLVYQRSVSPLPKVLPETLGQLMKQSRQAFTTGKDKARKFFEGAEYYRQKGELALSMFMLQQTSETTFRTIALSLYGREKRTHSIRSLKRFNHRLAPQLNDIFPGGSPDEERLLQLIEDAYSGGRYNFQYEISVPDYEEMFFRVSRLQELAVFAFEERMRVILISMS
ncbi:HEPN domain-containing protein [Dyadobacter pollutisoli]|uniref:HEPN domain-containing protein n=1 Tax=Dyadobacter pollutisoli TaxID=2910158 RepID=A0A9E8SJD6_9BACT|nr:HEPN domain-containing protein [Dyadobacter pollutisoli]WAC11235.1 HEPN domain-containing protein [Dyadobacter pollutisoli]